MSSASGNEPDVIPESSPARGAHKAPVDERFEAAIAAARQGSRRTLGSLFEECRNYLLLIANRSLGESIQAKIGASDLVQETFLQAHQIFDRFDGSSQKELLAWLVHILEFKRAQTVRRYVKTEMRNVSRELPIEIVEASLVHDNRRLTGQSPDSAVGQSEKLERFKAALERLPANYRVAIELRGLREKSFSELANEMHRSEGAVRKIWIRAVQRLIIELQTSAVRQPSQA